MNTLVWSATNIIIWGLVMSGCFATRSAWIVSMYGSEAILIGIAISSAMIVLETIALAIIIPGINRQTSTHTEYTDLKYYYQWYGWNNLAISIWTLKAGTVKFSPSREGI